MEVSHGEMKELFDYFITLKFEGIFCVVFIVLKDLEFDEITNGVILQHFVYEGFGAELDEGPPLFQVVFGEFEVVINCIQSHIFFKCFILLDRVSNFLTINVHGVVEEIVGYFQLVEECLVKLDGCFGCF